MWLERQKRPSEISRVSSKFETGVVANYVKSKTRLLQTGQKVIAGHNPTVGQKPCVTR